MEAAVDLNALAEACCTGLTALRSTSVMARSVCALAFCDEAACIPVDANPCGLLDVNWRPWHPNEKNEIKQVTIGNAGWILFMIA
jgi:hypothetical protein